jgi:hypothetical protein
MLVRSIKHKRDGEYHENQEARERQREVETKKNYMGKRKRRGK